MNNFIVLLFFILILFIILLLINIFISNTNPDEAKISAYEAIFNAIPGQTRSIFHIHFFIVALLFLIFDLEIILIMPVGVTLYDIGNFCFTIFLIFFIILTIFIILL